MKKNVFYGIALLIGVSMALYHASDITTFAKEDDEFLMGGGYKV